MTFNAVKGEFVTGSTTTESGFCPATDFDARVGADDGVALFCEGRMGCGSCADHGFWEEVFLWGGGVTFCYGADIFDVEEGGFLCVVFFFRVRFDVLVLVVVLNRLRCRCFGGICDGI